MAQSQRQGAIKAPASRAGGAGSARPVRVALKQRHCVALGCARAFNSSASRPTTCNKPPPPPLSSPTSAPPLPLPPLAPPPTSAPPLPPPRPAQVSVGDLTASLHKFGADTVPDFKWTQDFSGKLVEYLVAANNSGKAGGQLDAALRDKVETAFKNHAFKEVPLPASLLPLLDEEEWEDAGGKKKKAAPPPQLQQQRTARPTL